MLLYSSLSLFSTPRSPSSFWSFFSVKSVPCMLLTILIYLSLQFSLFVNSHVITEEKRLMKFVNNNTNGSDHHYSPRVFILDSDHPSIPPAVAADADIIISRVKRIAMYDWQKDDSTEVVNDSNKGYVTAAPPILLLKVQGAAKKRPKITAKSGSYIVNDQNNTREQQQQVIQKSIDGHYNGSDPYNSTDPYNDTDPYNVSSINNDHHIDHDAKIRSDIKAILWSSDLELTTNATTESPSVPRSLEFKKDSPIANKNNGKSGKILSKIQGGGVGINNVNEDISFVRQQQQHQISKKVNNTSLVYDSDIIGNNQNYTSLPSTASSNIKPTNLDDEIDDNKRIQNKMFYNSRLSVSEDKLRAYTLSENQRYGVGRAKPRLITAQLSKAKIIEYNGEDQEYDPNSYHH